MSAMTGGHRPNMRQMALLAGVSHMTVSRVINDHPSIAPATRERVLLAMRQLNYTPNGAARALATRKTNRIGVLVSLLAIGIDALCAPGRRSRPSTSSNWGTGTSCTSLVLSTGWMRAVASGSGTRISSALATNLQARRGDRRRKSAIRGRTSSGARHDGGNSSGANRPLAP